MKKSSTSPISHSTVEMNGLKQTKNDSLITDKIIREFLFLNNRRVSKRVITGLLIRLQNAISDGLITKKSPVVLEITIIQDRLLKLHRQIKSSAIINLDDELMEKLFIALKKHPKAFKATTKLKSSQKKIVGKNKKNPSLGTIEPVTIEGATNEAPRIMSSVDFVKLEFKGLGFSGKWKDFIGDPSKGFTAMVFGKPKFGKSYLCIEFAGYLARNHGKVLYVAREEELDATLKIKLTEKSVAHPNLFVSDHLPTDLSGYDFIFLDSVSKLALTPEQLEALEKKYPSASFIYIFQVRKDGVFKGRNEYQHDVDVVIEVPEKGTAIQNGRFNQGGEMSIFKENKKLEQVII